MQNQELYTLGEEFYVQSVGGRLPVVLERGDGPWVWDVDDKKYLDFLAGIGVNSLGHRHPGVMAAICEQAGKILHTSNLYYNTPQVTLAERLVNLSGMRRVFFSNSGAEANEAAIKLARKFGKLKEGVDRFEIITALQSFHGRTLTTTAATGQPKYQKNFTPLPPGFLHVPLNDLDALKDVLTEHTVAILIEPIQGESGVNLATMEYLQALRELCDERDLLLIFDEIQCGVARTGSLFAYDQCGVQPDVVTLAKALAGGVPIGATLFNDRVADVFTPGDHSSTFGGNPLACAAAHAALDAYLEDGFLQHVQEMGKYLKAQLEKLQVETGAITDIRVFGLMAAFDLSISAPNVNNHCLASGLLVNAIGNHTIRCLPPLIIEKEHIDLAVEIFRGAIQAVQGTAK